MQCVGLAEQVRIPLERDGDGEGKSVQRTAVVSDLHLTAEEMGRIKRAHRAIENKLRHVLDDTFREDRSPARGSKNNLTLIMREKL